MESFSITTRLDEKEYVKVMYIGLYRKPEYIIATIIGLYYAVTIVLNDMGAIHYYGETPYFELCLGAILLLFPSLIVLASVRQGRSGRIFQQEMTFAFDENGIRVQAPTCKSEFVWGHIIKRKEIGNFLILYHSKKFGNFIDKRMLTNEHLEFIRSKVNRK